MSINAYDIIAVLDRDIPGHFGDEIVERIVAPGSGRPILIFTAADRLGDKASGFGLGADSTQVVSRLPEGQEILLPQAQVQGTHRAAAVADPRRRAIAP